LRRIKALRIVLSDVSTGSLGLRIAAPLKYIGESNRRSGRVNARFSHRLGATNFILLKDNGKKDSCDAGKSVANTGYERSWSGQIMKGNSRAQKNKN
jgi:hypothetical protein